MTLYDKMRKGKQVSLNIRANGRIFRMNWLNSFVFFIKMSSNPFFFVFLQQLKISYMVTIIILIILLILALLIVPLMRDMVKDKQELADTPINKKFEILVSKINDGLFDGRGEVVLFDDDSRSMNLFSDDNRNYLIQFYYSKGNLTITLNYKFFQKELIHKELYQGLRNISVFMQKDIANQFLEVCNKEIIAHQKKVGYDDVRNMSGVQDLFRSESDPTSVLSDVYSDLSLSQKKSVINLMYLIGKSAGDDEGDVEHTVAFSQEVLTLNVLPEDCIKQNSTYGEGKIFEDLKPLDRSVLDMIVLACFQLVGEMNVETPNQIDPLMESCFFDSFSKLGYSVDDIEQLLQKMMAMQQFFGL